MEVVLATLLVGIVLVGALRCAGAVIAGRVSIGDRAQAQHLAAALLGEVIACEYADPDETPTFGTEPSEQLGDRFTYDDVDDYHAWDASPPERRAGIPYSELPQWRRQAIVEFVRANDPTQVSTITVSRSGVTMAQLVAIRSDKS